jgi:hypothetical protein
MDRELVVQSPIVRQQALNPKDLTPQGFEAYPDGWLKLSVALLKVIQKLTLNKTLYRG